MNRPNPPAQTKLAAMKRPVVASVIFHVVLLVVMTGSFTFFRKDFPLDEPIAVELLPVAERAESTIDAPVAKKLPDPPKPEPVVEQKPTPPAKSVEPPKDVVEPPKPKEPEKPKEKPKPKQGDLPDKKKDKKPKEKPEEKPEEQTDEQFQSVLKNLVGEDSPMLDKTDAKDTERQAPVLTAPAPLGSQMSMSEMDALKAQLARCWNILPGAREAEDLVIDVDVDVGEDKIVRSAKLVDSGRYNENSFYRAAADSALRAVRAPDCTPLDLPDGKYDQWKSMTIRFDPKEMF